MARRSYIRINYFDYRWVSEKFDGIRIFWDGRNMFNKNGEILSTSLEMREQLPKHSLDGEIWYS